MNLSLLPVPFALFAFLSAASAQPAAAPSGGSDDEIEATQLVHGVQAAVRIYSKDPAKARPIAAAALAEIARIYNKLDKRNRESETAAINSAAGTEEVIVSEETQQVLVRALDLCRRTGGAYDPTVATYEFLWNFENRPFVRPLADELAVRRAMTGCAKVVQKPTNRAVRLGAPMIRLTLAGVLHGFALERTSELLRRAGFTDFRIRLGDDVFAQGRVGTRHWLTTVPNSRRPDGTGLPVYLTSQAAVTVTDSEHVVYKNGKRYHDELDPRTGLPVEGVVQATVIATDPTAAAALAHALFVLGPKAGLAMLAHDKQGEGFLIDSHGKLWASPGMGDLAHLPPSVPVD